MDGIVAAVVGGAMVIMTVVVLGAVFTGNGQALCDKLQGSYDTTTGNCAGGSWMNVFRDLPRPKQ